MDTIALHLTLDLLQIWGYCRSHTRDSFLADLIRPLYLVFGLQVNIITKISIYNTDYHLQGMSLLDLVVIPP